MLFSRIILFLALSYAALAHAASPYTPQVSDPTLSELAWREFPELSRIRVSASLNDPQGNIWLGTQNNRVWKFDGVELIDQGLPNQPINALEWYQNTIWVATDECLYYLDGTTWRHAFPKETTMPWMIADVTADAQGRLWAGSIWGAFVMENNKWKLFAAEAIALRFTELFPWLETVQLPDEIVDQKAFYNFYGFYSVTTPTLDNSIMIVGLDPEGPAAKLDIKIGDWTPNFFDIVPNLDEAFKSKAAVPSFNISLLRPLRISKVNYSIPPTIPNDSSFNIFSPTSIFEDDSGHIWFGLFKGKVVSYESKSDTWSSRGRLEKDGAYWNSQRFAQTTDGTIWTRSPGGVSRYDGTNWIFEQLDADQHTVFSLEAFGDNTLWATLVPGGIAVRSGDGNWTIYDHRNPAIPNYRVELMKEVREGKEAVWLFAETATRYSINDNPLSFYNNLHYAAEDPKGTLWYKAIKGQKVFSRSGEQWQEHLPEDTGIDLTINILKAGESVAVFGTADNRFAVSIYSDEQWEIHPVPLSISDPGVCIQAIGGDELWFMFVSDPIRRYLKYNTADQSWREYNIWDISQKSMLAMSTAQDGKLWMASHDTLALYHPEHHQIQTWPFPKDVLAGNIQALVPIGESKVWIAAGSQGLLTFDNGQWLSPNLDDPNVLNFNNITQIDESKYIASDGHHLFRFNTYSHEKWSKYPITDFDTFHATSGGSASKFIESIGVTEDNRFFINQPTGVIEYRPDTVPPETEFRTAPDTAYHNADIPFQWSGIDTTDPIGSFYYSYKLDDAAWSDFSKSSTLILSDQASGAHTLQVRARDEDWNIDPSPAIAHFNILPPLWQQPLYQIAAICLIILFGFLIWLIIVQHDKRIVSEANYHEQMAREDKRMAEFRLNLFTGISHDLKTPLTLILGPTLDLLDPESAPLNDRQRKKLNLIHQNATRMLHHIEQLLDLRKIEAGMMKRVAKKSDLIQFIHSVLEPFQQDASHNNSSLRFEYSEPSLEVFFDEQKLETILINLLSNAFKFSPKNDTVTLKLDYTASKDEVTLSITDNGPGIAESDREHIFEAFYQSTAEDKCYHRKGSGFGLALVSELVNIHGGKIHFDTKTDPPHTFTRLIVTLNVAPPAKPVDKLIS